MKKKILIFSAGSAGREIFQLISSINKFKDEWEVIGYVDDDVNKVDKIIDKIQVYSNKKKPKNKEIYATCGVMNHIIRKKSLRFIKLTQFVSLLNYHILK